MSKAQRKNAPTNCRVCGSPTNGGHAYCTLHNPRRATDEHRDKYADRKG